jgi:hypothetical protein
MVEVALSLLPTLNQTPIWQVLVPASPTHLLDQAEKQFTHLPLAQGRLTGNGTLRIS